jgi:hypothetical protein
MLGQYPEQLRIPIVQTHMLVINVNLTADRRHDQPAYKRAGNGLYSL